MLPEAKSHFHLLRRGWELPLKTWSFPLRPFQYDKKHAHGASHSRGATGLRTLSQAPRSHFGVRLPLSFSCTRGHHQLHIELKSKQNILVAFPFIRGLLCGSNLSHSIVVLYMISWAAWPRGGTEGGTCSHPAQSGWWLRLWVSALESGSSRGMMLMQEILKISKEWLPALYFRKLLCQEFTLGLNFMWNVVF